MGLGVDLFGVDALVLMLDFDLAFAVSEEGGFNVRDSSIYIIYVLK